MTSPSNANTTADRNALRVRNSMARSFRAMSHASDRISATSRDRLSIDSWVLCEVDVRPIIEANEASTVHNRRARGEGKTFSEIVGDDDDRSTRGPQLLQQLGEC